MIRISAMPYDKLTPGPLRIWAGVLLIAVLASAAGLTSSAQDISATPVSDPNNTAAFGSAKSTSKAAVQEHQLSLQEALTIAMIRNPDLLAADLEVQARQDETWQAGLRPNPELQTDIENFGGTGSLSGARISETTISVGQLIELGGKRARRVTAARLDARLAKWDLESRRIELNTSITRLYIDAVARDRLLEVATKLLEISERLRDAVGARVSAGKVSPIENERALIVVGKVRADYDAADAAREEAFSLLAIALGKGRSDIEALSGVLAPATVPPSKSVLIGYISDNPEIARWATEVDARQAALDIERANRIPDVQVGGGVRYFEDVGDTAFVATLTVPLPLFNRNQGAIAAASKRVDRSRAEADSAVRSTNGQFEASYAKLKSSAMRSIALDRDLSPAARKAFEATEIGYREGKFDLVTLLDAQRTYFEIETDAISALAEYYSARAVIEALIGRDLSTLSNPSAGDQE